MSRARAPIPFAIASAVLVFATRAFALDKQGAGAHGGAVQGADEGFDLSGNVGLGVSLDNPSYAARPDNTGLVLMRYLAHADVDVIGRRLSFPLDINVFTDRTRPGLRKFAPTELDFIGGATSTWGLGPGALELGARVEQDSPVDRGTFNQRYIDTRVRWLYSLATAIPSVGHALDDGDVSGWFTLGWFAYNPTYAARPDNTGIARFRYAIHSEVSVWSDHLSFGFDGTMFTDKRAASEVRPSELDFTEELIVRGPVLEYHLAYEQDHPVDRRGLVQSFAYLLVVYGFDVVHQGVKPLLEEKEHIPSP